MVEICEDFLVSEGWFFEFADKLLPQFCVVVRLREEVGMILDIFDVPHSYFHHIHDL